MNELHEILSELREIHKEISDLHDEVRNFFGLFELDEKENKEVQRNEQEIFSSCDGSVVLRYCDNCTRGFGIIG